MVENNNNNFCEIRVDFPAGVKLEMFADPAGVRIRMGNNDKDTRTFDANGDAAEPIECLLPWTEYYRIRRKVMRPGPAHEKKPETQAADVG